MYGAGVAAARLVTRVAPANGSKLWRSFAARRGLLDRVTTVARRTRVSSRPLVWMHAPSVGEGLQARPVAHRLRVLHPELQMAYTFFSPSAERFAQSIGAEITDYLPFDGAAEADAMLDAIQPNLLVFVKLDVWPTLVARATARGIPVALLSGTVAARSARLGPMSRLLVRDAYSALQGVAAIDAANAERLRMLGVRAEVLEVAGDTRFDQVWMTAQGVKLTDPLLRRLSSERPTLVAGSTWPADESVLLPAMARLKGRARLIIAPHEPTTAHVAPIVVWAASAELSCATLSEVEQDAAKADCDVIVLDRVGVLGQLYALADVAFVGGGFHAAGLHSVIEPAAFGAPVLFGPGHDMSREAGLLLAANGARTVTDIGSMEAALSAWLFDDASRSSAGQAALELVRSELGATDRSVALIQRMLRRQI